MHPFAILFFIFLAVPIIEIYLLIKVGGIIGAIPTIGLVIFTAVLGAFLLRIQGFATLAKIRETLARGGIPAIEMIEGAVLLVAGALLLTPGFFTDAIGFASLVPPFRRYVILRFLQQFFQPMTSRQPRGSSHTHSQHHKPDVIEGEFHKDKD